MLDLEILYICHNKCLRSKIKCVSPKIDPIETLLNNLKRKDGSCRYYLAITVFISRFDFIKRIWPFMPGRGNGVLLYIRIWYFDLNIIIPFIINQHMLRPSSSNANITITMCMCVCVHVNSANSIRIGMNSAKNTAQILVLNSNFFCCAGF